MRRDRPVFSRPGVVVTSNDVQLFRWLWMLRVMTLGQLRRVGYYQPETGRLSALDNVRKRLSRLRKAGYLTGDRLMDTRERIYLLAEDALEPLRDVGIVQRRLYRPKGMETLSQVHHSLLVSECAVRLTESIRASSISIPDLAPLSVPFYHTHAVGDPRKRKHIERFVTQEDLQVSGQEQSLRVRPDLVFGLAHSQVTRLYFLEADRGFESTQQIAAKQLAYHHYQQVVDSGDSERRLWQRYGAVRDFRVLFVTTDDQRIESLVRSLREQPGFKLMAFSTADAVKEENIVFDPIWTNAYGSGRMLARKLPT